jgi:hypothetical protein
MSGENKLKLRFSAGEVAAENLETEISSILSEFADPESDATLSAIAAGLSPAAMKGAQATVKKEAKGFAPVAILIVIAAPVAVHTIDKFWDDVIWPRVRSRLGSDALGKREDEE